MTTTRRLTGVDNTVGQPIPPGTAHAVSVSLPSWKANVAYEEGENWVLNKMGSGYPRFFIHKSIQAFAAAIVHKYGEDGEEAFLFPSHAIAERCLDFLRAHTSMACCNLVRTVDLVTNSTMNSAGTLSIIPLTVSAVIIPRALYGVAKAFWQHTGDGVSSRRAEYCHQAFNNGSLVESRGSSSMEGRQRSCKGPKRYQRAASIQLTQAHPSTELNEIDRAPDNSDRSDYTQFVEERFGRNLDMSFVKNAKLAIKRRIAGSLTANVDLKEALKISSGTSNGRRVKDFSEMDVFLYPTGMSAIFNTHRTLMAARGALRSICFGFPYIDTLKILEKWGAGCLFYGHGSLEDLNDLERRLKQGERYLALFCEFPSNPLLKTPDLQRIRALATAYDFAIVVDETISNFLNVHVLTHADVVVSSLTKVFSGDSNVMGGSCVLNPQGPYYTTIKDILSAGYEDNYWVEDVIFMERNSRDFVSRIERINANAEAICDVLMASSDVKEVYYPKFSSSRCYYDQFRNPHGGYGGLLSITFNSAAEAVSFFDALETAKGPSLGTNFTLSSPYAILAHYAELDWVASYGVDANLVRVSVGLEAAAELCAIFKRALRAMKLRVYKFS